MIKNKYWAPLERRFWLYMELSHLCEYRVHTINPANVKLSLFLITYPCLNNRNQNQFNRKKTGSGWIFFKIGMPQNIKTKHYTKHLVFPKVRINWSSFSQYNIYKDIKSLRNIYIIKGLLKYWLFKSFKEEKGILLGWIQILIIFFMAVSGSELSWRLDSDYLDGLIRIRFSRR